MRYLLLLFVTLCSSAAVFATELSPDALVAQFYQAHRSKHDPLQETALLGRYFDPELLKLYLKDKREARGEVGRVDGDPLYNAQETEITNFSISKAQKVGGETSVRVTYSNLSKPARIVFIVTETANGWRISDIRYDDGSSLKKILQTSL